VFMRFGANTFI